MSAYVVDDVTINKVISFLSLKARGNGLHAYDRTALADLGYDLQDPGDCERLANDMFALNCNAVEQRYGKGQAAEFRPLNFRYRREMPAPAVPTLKALECWLYQCAEGDVPATSDLYKAMRNVQNLMCREIVHNLPAYDRAPW